MKINVDKLAMMNFKIKLFEFIKWKLVDALRCKKNEFNQYGLTMYCGRQGAGKTIAIVEYLERMRKKFPDAIIVTNFGYIFQDQELKSWRDLVTIKNGTKGVIFAIDEIQNEFSSNSWKDFPEFILREVTQQRKQRVKIVASSQVFTRVVKPLREQCYEVVECFTLAGRWTFTKAFDADEYNAVIDKPDRKVRLRRLWRYNFIGDDMLRGLYDSYKKIESIKDKEYIPRHERIV